MCLIFIAYVSHINISTRIGALLDFVQGLLEATFLLESFLMIKRSLNLCIVPDVASKITIIIINLYRPNHYCRVY